MTTYLLPIGVAIILILSAVAAYYLVQLKNLKQKQALQQAENEASWRKHQQELCNDLKFIAKAMLQGQCEITEGCLRITYLMSRLDESLLSDPSYSTVVKHAGLTAHMPTHQAYKDLTRKEQFKLDQERFKLEETNKKAVLKEAALIADISIPSLNTH